MKPKRIPFLLFLIIVLWGCKYNNKVNENYPPNLKNAYLIPIGRPLKNTHIINVLLNNKKYEPAIYTDDSNGKWIVIPYHEVKQKREITIRFKNIKTSFSLLKSNDNSSSKWLNPVKMIDSNNKDIISLSKKLIEDCKSIDEKMKKFQHYILDNIQHRDYPEHFNITASKTLELKYGTCVNRARLFVALCRAADIPARTVWGYIYPTIPMDRSNEGHHEWPEFLNDNGEWQPVELDKRLYTYRGLKEPFIGHFDLIYAVEENPVYLNRLKHNNKILYMAEGCSWKEGKFGYKIIKLEWPDIFEIEIKFKLS